MQFRTTAGRLLQALCLIAGGTLNAVAEQWEVGALGGAGLYLDRPVTAGAQSGHAGFRPGWAAGGWLGHNAVGRWGGEIRYLYQQNDLRLTSGGSDVRFAGRSHTIHYDVVIHTSSREDRIRPYFAVGAGMKGYQGTGAERAVQPLAQLAILSRTTEWRPLVTAAAGIKWAIGRRMMLRVEVRDYVTPFPKEVILPAPGARIGGWLHDIVPTVGLSYLFP